MKITLSPASIEELHWWTSPNIQTFNGQSLQTCPIKMTVLTDASLGLGGNLASDNDWGSVATQQGPVIYQSSGTEGSIPSFIQVLHSGSSFLHSPPDGQFNGGSLYQQERGHAIAHPVKASCRFVGSGPECWFVGYGETYPRHIQRGGRQGILSF